MKINIEQEDTGGTLAVDLAILRPQVGHDTAHFYLYLSNAPQTGLSEEVWQVTGCLSQGYRSIPLLNASYESKHGYYCPRGRKIFQSAEHFSGSPVFDQVTTYIF